MQFSTIGTLKSTHKIFRSYAINFAGGYNHFESIVL